MNVKPRKALEQLPDYVPAKNKEETEREYGIGSMLKLAGNENVLGCAPGVKEAVLHAYDKLAYYPDMNCSALRRALADRHGISPESLIFGNGSFELISIIGQTFLEEGSEAITVQPSFGWYSNVTFQAGASLVNVPLIDFKLNIEDLKKAVTDKTKVIWLCNPNNPIGFIIKNNVLEEFLGWLREDIVVVLDEAYIDFVEEEGFPDSISLLDDYSNIILLRTFSKLYGLASLRLGYGIASEELINCLNKVRQPVNVNTLAAEAALASLNDQVFLQKVLENNRRGLDYYYRELSNLGLKYVRSNCNFIFFETGIDSDLLTEKFLREGIILRGGKEYGYPLWLRVTIGKEQDNIRVIEALKKILHDYERSVTYI